MAMWFAIASVLILTLFGWLFAWYNQRQLNKVKQQLVKLETTLRAELTSVNSGAIGIGQRIIVAEKKLGDLEAVQDNQQHSNPENRPYLEAAALVEQGADASQLMEQCGLSEAEANLITMMKQGQASNNSH
jgi:hypothetical protein